MTRTEITELIQWLELQKGILSPAAARGVDQLMPELRELAAGHDGSEPEPGTVLWKLRELRAASVRVWFSRD